MAVTAAGQHDDGEYSSPFEDFDPNVGQILAKHPASWSGSSRSSAEGTHDANTSEDTADLPS
jgi:hypothetical protein